MNILLVIAGLALVSGVVLMALWFYQNRKFGILSGNKVYTDSDRSPGEVLFSKTLALSGKPDYLIKENNMVFPVEVKSGRTPDTPYESHTMQLMAYCLLVEENYGVRPIGGYIKYPEKEFKVAYTDEAKDSIKELVGEMLLLKHSGRELKCSHPEHNR